MLQNTRYSEFYYLKHNLPEYNNSIGVGLINELFITQMTVVPLWYVPLGGSTCQAPKMLMDIMVQEVLTSLHKGLQKKFCRSRSVRQEKI